ncbi:MAG: phenylalanine--tRNA ligase subunit beta [Candidatus Berkelbacteria bacterium]|nr:phenylalanine--tRNA ligase subunit beta [Candidatus Berkelbacteria bacterium]
MLAPLSWLKKYVDIKMNPSELAERLTEVGLGCEKITRVDGDVIFEFEITPNRPDLLSIVGIAREIAAIEKKNIKLPKAKVDVQKVKPSKTLPLDIETDPKINPRFTGIIINGISVKESPKWLQERLIKIGQRPINNIVDITNYVMLELGNPIHAFDYDKIEGKIMRVDLSKGGEKFESVDGISYSLPQNAVVISDEKKIIDLCGIKGAKNSGTFSSTKTIFIRVPVEIPTLIRKTSQSLGLRSEASSIFERGVNAGGTIETLNRCVDLILEIAGGEIASKIYDLKKENFEPWKLNLRIERLNKILGIEIPEKKATGILDSLNLNPVIDNAKRIECTIPTYRNDLKIEEDLIEEVARLYGYNNFPKTMPTGEIPTLQIPYFKDYAIDEKAKQILRASGFSEIYTYSLTVQGDLRVDNPVSREFEYLRPTLKSNLTKALLQNKPYFKEINLFELGKAYLGKTIDKAREAYFLSGISNAKSFYEVKGILERLFEELGIKEDPGKAIEVVDEGIFFELDFSHLISLQNAKKTFIPLPKYPPIMEDFTLIVKESVKTGEIIDLVKKQSELLIETSLLDQFEDTRTFHVVYQHKEKNLTRQDVTKIREKILKALKEKFGAKLKEQG